jgi:excisionase family DNA binding protein
MVVASASKGAGDELRPAPLPTAAQSARQMIEIPTCLSIRVTVERNSRFVHSQLGGSRRRRNRRDTSGIERPAPLTVQEVAVELECSEEDVRALIRAGELRTVACGIRPGRVPRHVLEEYRRRLEHRG